MKLKLKVCGMKLPDNIQAVASLQPAYMGFIFYEKSPRYVGKEFTLAENFPASVAKVGVFVNEATGEMMRQLDRLHLDYLQLHGNESVEQVKALKQHGVNVIKVFSIGDDFDFDIVNPYEEYVSYFLFDTKGKHYGGNAATFDWSILQQYNQRVPFFLSGGLSPENVNSVGELRGMNIHALDVNSGVEQSPGLKNIAKIKSLFETMSTLAL